MVKNVTGYDLARGFCSSWGTLAVATSFSIKVLPRAAKECTFVLLGLTAQQASEAMSEAMDHPLKSPPRPTCLKAFAPFRKIMP